MDTKYWGPSGWQLLHLITFERGSLNTKKNLFSTLNEILPCKYCRESTGQFMKEMPIHNNLALWLYDLHKQVNKKLESQGLHVAPNPGFSQVVKKYREELKNVNLPGIPFLFSIAYNFDPKTHSKESHEKFWLSLKDLYPKNGLPRIPKIHECYFREVYDIFKELGYEKSYSETLKELLKHKSSCSKKTFKGKTCRRKRKLNNTNRIRF
jgi:hypothetical protein